MRNFCFCATPEAERAVRIPPKYVGHVLSAGFWETDHANGSEALKPPTVDWCSLTGTRRQKRTENATAKPLSKSQKQLRFETVEMDV
jgi:hypothetical protein